jgi:hypothetical protein
MIKTSLLPMVFGFSLVLCHPASAQIKPRSSTSLANQNIQRFDDAMPHTAGFLMKHLGE